jgi:hypothetical protein
MIRLSVISSSSPAAATQHTADRWLATFCLDDLKDGHGNTLKFRSMLVQKSTSRR